MLSVGGSLFKSSFFDKLVKDLSKGGIETIHEVGKKTSSIMKFLKTVDLEAHLEEFIGWFQDYQEKILWLFDHSYHGTSRAVGHFREVVAAGFGNINASDSLLKTTFRPKSWFEPIGNSLLDMLFLLHQHCVSLICTFLSK